MHTRNIFHSTLLFALVLSGLPGCGAPEEGTPGDEALTVSAQTAAVVVTCPDPKSCADWSGWTNSGPAFCQQSVASCSTEICRPCHCNQDDCQTCCTSHAGPATEQLQQSFRDCTLQNHRACRETREQTVVAACGC